MAQYVCKRCGYTVNHKYNFIKHLQRKKVCKPIMENIDINVIKKQFNDDTGAVFLRSLTNPSQSLTNPSQIPHKSLTNPSQIKKP